MPYGYEYGNTFGDPNRFTRGTQESEIDRFNQWMRSQPFWQQIAAQGQPGKHWSDAQAAMLQQALASQGIAVPKNFHIDEGGNFNQKSRVKRNLAIGGLIAAGLLTGGGALGMGPLAGVMGGTGGTGGLLAGTGTAGSINTAALGGFGTSTFGSGVGGMAGLMGAGSVVPSAALGTGGTGLATSALVPSTITGLTTPGVGAAATNVGVSATPTVGGGSSFISGARRMGTNMLKNRGNNQEGEDDGTRGSNLADIASLFGAEGQAAASSRAQRGVFTQNADRGRMEAAQQQREAEADAMRKLAQASYILSGGMPAPDLNVRSGRLSGANMWLPPISDAQREAALNLQNMVKNRVTPEGQIKITDPSTYLNETTGEKVGKWGSRLATGLNIASNLWGK